MYILEIRKNGKKSLSAHDTFEEAAKYFKANERLGFQCAIFSTADWSSES